MAVAYVQEEFEIADRSTENYEVVADKIGDGPFDGLIVHTAGFDDEAGGLRVLPVAGAQAVCEGGGGRLSGRTGGRA